MIKPVIICVSYVVKEIEMLYICLVNTMQPVWNVVRICPLVQYVESRSLNKSEFLKID